MARRKRRDWGRGWVEVRQRRDGPVYVARWLEDGRQKSRTFSDPLDAEDHLDDLARQKRRLTPTRGEVPTVAMAAASWLRAGRHTWAGGTYHTYRTNWERWVEPVFGDVRLDRVTAAMIMDWIEELRGQYKTNTILSQVAVLRGIYTHAVRTGMTSATPFAGVRIGGSRAHTGQAWTADEVRRILSVTSDDPWWHAFYLVALTTGLRRGEVLSLRWEDIDLDGGIVQVWRTMAMDDEGRVLIAPRTKGKRRRKVVVPAMVCDALRRMGPGKGLVFCRPDGRVYQPTTLRNQHRVWCGKAGVRHVRLHDLRHTTATRLLEANVNPKVVSEVLGHSSTAVTLEVYQHVSEDLIRQAASVLEAAIDPERQEN